MTSKEKARLLGLFFWLFTIFNIFVVSVIAVVYVALFGLIFTQAPSRSGNLPPGFMVAIFAVAFAFALLFTLLFSIPKVVAGYGLRNEIPWARTWAIVASAMACMSFPFGTAIGVFGLIFLLGDEGKLYFESPAYGRLPGALNSLPPNNWQ